MKLKSFRVTRFRNIVDSGEINVDSAVTCLVGKNEAGKSGLIEALYLLNPAYDEKFNADDQYPRWLVTQDRKSGALGDRVPITAKFELGDDDIRAVNDELGHGVITDSELVLEKKYGAGTVWTFQWSEAAIAAEFVDSFPVSVAAKVDKISELAGLHKAVNEMEAAEEGPTAEEIKAAKQLFIDRKITKRLEGWSRIVEILKVRLPKFFKFSQYSTLPGRIDLKALGTTDEGPGRTANQTARALLSLAGTDIKQIQSEDYELRKAELEAVQIDLTRQVFEYWKQNPNLQVLIDIDKVNEQQGNGTTAIARYLDIRLSDSRTGYSNNFSQRSSGFQWFFSFLAAFSEFEGKADTIVLLDEPALSLHGKAQGDFLRFINERLSPSSPVIYTTHSPFMVEPGRLERVRVVEDQGPPVGTTVSDDVLASDQDSLFPLQAALGYDIAQSLFIGPNNLVVEGTSDFIYLTVMSTLCVASGRDGLNERWRILPAGGAANIPTFVSLIGRHLDITVVADSDTQGMQRVTNMVKQKLLKDTRLIMISVATKSNNADIEDLFSESDYLNLYNDTFSEKLTAKDLPKGDRIVKRIEVKIGTSYDHGRVSETLLRNHQSIKFSEETLDNFSKLNAAINATLAT